MLYQMNSALAEWIVARKALSIQIPEVAPLVGLLLLTEIRDVQQRRRHLSFCSLKALINFQLSSVMNHHTVIILDVCKSCLTKENFVQQINNLVPQNLITKHE